MLENRNGGMAASDWLNQREKMFDIISLKKSIFCLYQPLQGIIVTFSVFCLRCPDRFLFTFSENGDVGCPPKLEF